MTVLTVWSDIGCPWAGLALHTVRAAARSRGRELLIDHRAFPLELFNAEPTPRHIVEPEVVVIGAARPELGWRLWAGRDAAYPSTTLPALEAVQAAKDPAIGGLRGSDALDAALRHAFYAESRCISIVPVILDVAARCPEVDADALAEALARGAGRAEVFAQWRAARDSAVRDSAVRDSAVRDSAVRDSPHLFGPYGWAAHNPGVRLTWTGDPQAGGLPRLESFDPGWADTFLDHTEAQAGPAPPA
ncbi:dithiol-disulfide isomerase [Streptomyces sp. NPDC001508]|uniref:DsbA family oxidoreductase n=1 Tax=Streptomyces sp. NPDC001508 TaxID=3154656 RepID=UPI00332F629A